MSYQRIPESDYKHALYSLRSQLNAIWNSCRCYGLTESVDMNIEETVLLCENFAMRVRGKDIPLGKYSEYKPRVTE